MEREVWTWIVAFVGRITNREASRRFTFCEREIVGVDLWAALHDRPTSWAWRAANWPADLRPSHRPTPSTMSRRVRRTSFAAFLAAAQRRLRQGAPRGLLHIVDGKPLPIGNPSHDPDAG